MTTWTYTRCAATDTYTHTLYRIQRCYMLGSPATNATRARRALRNAGFEYDRTDRVWRYGVAEFRIVPGWRGSVHVEHL